MTKALERVCANCFDDVDLSNWIIGQGGPLGCDACGQVDAPTAAFVDLIEHMRSCLCRYFGFAADQLPYESREGGYLGPHWDTYDLLEEKVGLSLPRDNDGHLYSTLAQDISDQYWCEFDWLSLELDHALALDWARFCKIIQHQRRFFFQDFGVDENDHDQRSPQELLHFICRLVERLGLIITIPKGTRIYRARDFQRTAMNTFASSNSHCQRYTNVHFCFSER
jgi:HEPN/RES N-terminal domain 1